MFILSWLILLFTSSSSGSNTSMINDSGAATLSMSNVTGNDSGQYVCTTQNQDRKLTVDKAVPYVKTPTISGKTTIKQGEGLNLTCTVDSFPLSVITWSKRGINQTLNNETKYGTSTLVIHNVTEQHSGQYVCHANHLNKTLEQDINITVINVWEMKITGEPTVREGSTLNLTCTVDSFPLSVITWSKRGINKTLNNETKYGTSPLVIHNMTEQHSGQYVCHANHLNKTLEQDINITVINVWEMKITGESTVREGSTLNLTCTVNSSHSIPITWVKLGMNKTLTNETGIKVGTSSLIIQNVTISNSGQYSCTTIFESQVQDINVTVTCHVLNLTCSVDSWPLSLITWTKSNSSTVLKNDTGSATLLIFNVVAENSGLYICTSEHLNISFTKEVHIKVKMQPQILDKSGCKSQQDVLTCVCISQGFPSPTITWKLSNHVDYSFNTVVSNHTVTSTVSINIKGVSNISAVCFSSNTNGQTSRNLSVNEVEDEGQITNFLQTFTQMGIIIPFLVGVLVSAFIFSWLWLCCRKKHKSHGRTSETLEMTNGGHTVDYEPILARGTAGGSNDPEAGTSDIEYSDIHLLIANPLEKKPKKEDTEYAKINPKKESKMEEGEGREEEEEIKLCVPEAEESETVAVYSNVKKLKDQMKETLTLAD
ncbi:basement membrane-specific heparan sulfate proteoglycan core protein-like isoform X2 [Gambusia affinis]|uniref:basement membrane-specific heparan sulfate proteoglycan core protein-like isoform X2 n=1 Tax=Gambusia affinis TaxID=33528 RepID=UPI001CDD2CB9|nr:basement membrane-specific heparan sulfate proteoglycan core protein-like isoform X2 [Gambusia affinis]